MTSRIKSASSPSITFHLLTIFPGAIDGYLKCGVIGRAIRRGLIAVSVYDLRDYSADKKHHKVDARPYGGGPGMVLEATPILKAADGIKRRARASGRAGDFKIIILTPGGRQFTNALALRWSKRHDHFILIAGRYEGIDARVKKILRAEEVSIGPYVLSGGELPAAVLIDTISRQVRGVLGDKQSLEEKRGVRSTMYTRPEVLTHTGHRYHVPKALLSGHHARITEWQSKHSKPALGNWKLVGYPQVKVGG